MELATRAKKDLANRVAVLGKPLISKNDARRAQEEQSIGVLARHQATATSVKRPTLIAYGESAPTAEYGSPSTQEPAPIKPPQESSGAWEALKSLIPGPILATFGLINTFVVNQTASLVFAGVGLLFTVLLAYAPYFKLEAKRVSKTTVAVHVALATLPL